MSAEALGSGVVVGHQTIGSSEASRIPVISDLNSMRSRTAFSFPLKEDLINFGRGCVRGGLVCGSGLVTVEYIAPEIFRYINTSLHVVYHPSIFWAEMAAIGISAVLAMYSAHCLTEAKE